MSLSNARYPLPSTGSTQEDPFDIAEKMLTAWLEIERLQDRASPEALHCFLEHGILFSA